MIQTWLVSSVILVAAAACAYAQTTIAPAFETKRWEKQGDRVCVESGYKLIGGGASVDGAGNLVSSFPDFPGRRSNNCWLATALGGGSLKVWAVGVRDTGSQWDVFIDQNAVDQRARTYPKVTVSLPPGYALTGGGVQIEKTTTGGLAGSYPTGIRSWEAIGAGLSSQAIITSYIIGIKPTGGGSLNAQIKPGTGSSAVPDTGYTLTGGGARITAGNSLLKSLRPESTGQPPVSSWNASANSGTSIVTHAVAIQSYPAPGAGPNFDTSWTTFNKTYFDEELKDENDTVKAACNGSTQSPVALPSTVSAASTAAPSFGTTYSSATGTGWVENTGHSFQMTLDAKKTCTLDKGADRKVTFDGATYKLKQYHFHHPSEHILDGVRYPLELHVVHENTDNTDAKKKGLVLAVFLRPATGDEKAESAFKAWETPPTTASPCIDAVNPAKLLPSGTYRQYDGSLTTPACGTGIKWIVYTTPVVVSQAVFKTIKDRSTQKSTARPLQALGKDRQIK